MSSCPDVRPGRSTWLPADRRSSGWADVRARSGCSRRPRAPPAKRRPPRSAAAGGTDCRRSWPPPRSSTPARTGGPSSRHQGSREPRTEDGDRRYGSTRPYCLGPGCARRLSRGLCHRQRNVLPASGKAMRSSAKAPITRPRCQCNAIQLRVRVDSVPRMHQWTSKCRIPAVSVGLLWSTRPGPPGPVAPQVRRTATATRQTERRAPSVPSLRPGHRCVSWIGRVPGAWPRSLTVDNEAVPRTRRIHPPPATPGRGRAVAGLPARRARFTPSNCRYRLSLGRRWRPLTRRRRRVSPQVGYGGPVGLRSFEVAEAPTKADPTRSSHACSRGPGHGFDDKPSGFAWLLGARCSL